MQVMVNEPYVRGKLKLGNISHMASLALLFVGFILSFLGETLGREAIYAAYVAMIVAFLLLNFGRPITRRWGARFRQDQWLIPGLRGVDNRHTLFNYAAADLPDHVLVGPTGLFVLVPKPNGGRIQFDGQRWSRGGIGAVLLRNLAEGGLGNPMADVQQAMSLLATYLKTHGSEDLIKGLEARPIVIFTNPKAQLDVRNSSVPVVHLRDLKSVFRRAKATLSQERVDELRQVLAREVHE